MKRLYLLLLIVSISLFSVLTGCENAVIKSDAVVLKMVFVPASDKSEDIDFASLLQIVEKITGYKIESVKVPDYIAAVESMRAGRADLAWFGAKTYIQASEIANAEAFAVGIPKGKDKAHYFTHFIVKKGSSITEFTKEQVGGKVIALNHVGSTSGDLIPRYELLGIGLNTTDKTHFKAVQYAGSHDAAIKAVFNSAADIGGVSSVNWEARLRDNTIKAEDFTIIHSSPPIQGAPLAYSKNLSEEVRRNVKAAVLEAHKHGTIGGYGGEMSHYVSVTDADYNIMRDIAKEVK